MYKIQPNPSLTPELQHHGIPGQKWGIRRFQPYPEGYTGDGKYLGDRNKRYYKDGYLSGKKIYKDVKAQSIGFSGGNPIQKYVNRKRYDKAEDVYSAIRREIATNHRYYTDIRDYEKQLKSGQYSEDVGRSVIDRLFTGGNQSLGKDLYNYKKNKDFEKVAKAGVNMAESAIASILDTGSLNNPKFTASEQKIKDNYVKAEKEYSKISSEFYKKLAKLDDESLSSEKRKSIQNDLDNIMMKYMDTRSDYAEDYTDKNGKINSKEREAVYIDNLGESFWSNPDDYADAYVKVKNQAIWADRHSSASDLEKMLNQKFDESATKDDKDKYSRLAYLIRNGPTVRIKPL